MYVWSPDIPIYQSESDSGYFKGRKLAKATGKLMKAKAVRPIRGETAPAVEVKLDTGHQFVCSNGHQIKLVDGSFRAACELNPNTQLSKDPLKMRDIYRKGAAPKIVSVTKVEDREMWDFEVPEYTEYYHQGCVHRSLGGS